MPVQPMTRYPHIVQAVYSRPWAMEPTTLALILDILRFRVDGGRFTADEIEQRIAAADHGPRATPRYMASRGDNRAAGRDAAPAIIPVYGPISQRQNLMAADSGGTSIEGLTQDFRAAMADPEVSGVIFEFDSPGGTIDGVDELASEIRAARGGAKPIVAVANSMAASAAYWLASAADEVVAIPSGSVGSIGVFAAHEDVSAKTEAEGTKMTLVSAGRYKTEGNPWEPLGDEARAHLQEIVDAHYGLMVGAIAKGRGVSVDDVRSGMGEGRIVLPKKALAAGMIDRIDTLDHTISRVARGAIPARSRDDAVAARGGYRLATDLSPDSSDEPGPDSAPSFGDRLALVSAQAEELLEHARNRADMRAKADRELTPDDRTGMRALASSLVALAGDPDPDPAPAPAWSPRARVRLALAHAEHDF